MSWFQWDKDDLILHLRLQPKASKDEWVGTYQDAYKIRITAPPIDGKANQYLIAFLAKQFKVAKKAVIVESGALSRHKRVRIKSPTKIPQGLTELQHNKTP